MRLFNIVSVSVAAGKTKKAEPTFTVMPGALLEAAARSRLRIFYCCVFTAAGSTSLSSVSFAAFLRQGMRAIFTISTTYWLIN